MNDAMTGTALMLFGMGTLIVIFVILLRQVDKWYKRALKAEETLRRIHGIPYNPTTTEEINKEIDAILEKREYGKREYSERRRGQ